MHIHSYVRTYICMYIHTYCMHIYIANLYIINMTIAISRQTIDILQPIYDTIDKAVRSVSGISCEVRIKH